MPGTVIKQESSLRILKKLNFGDENIPRHVIAVVNKNPKNKLSSQRDTNQWLLKKNELNPEFSSGSESDDSDIERSPDHLYNKEHEKDLYLDSKVQEYINFMTNDYRKSRVVMDGSRFAGKLSTFIPSLKTFHEFNFDNDVYFYQLAMAVKSGFAGNKFISINSMAQKLTLVQRLGIGDIHANNFGVDENGQVVLFDVEQALLFGLGCFEDGRKCSDFEKITQQPNESTLSIFRQVKQNCTAHGIFKRVLADDYAQFQRMVFKTLLKEIICPERVFTAIISKAEVPAFHGLSEWILKKLRSSQIELSEKLIAQDDFQTYFKNLSPCDLQSIFDEFDAAAHYHRHYFADAEVEVLLQEARGNYEYLKNRIYVAEAEAQIPLTTCSLC